MRKASHRLAALGILVLALCVAPTARAVESNGALKPGDVLDQSNWQKAEGLLLPEVLEHYKAGEFVNPIAEWPEGLQHYAQDFLKGTEENAGRFKLDEQGTILDNTSGRQPDYIMGLPFPQIDPADPQAAVKILWNYYYQWWYNGNALGNTAVEWVNATGLDRRSIQSVRFLYYDAQPRDLSPPQNPHNLLQQFLATTIEPADVYGTAALAWRFRDGDKRDLLWAYVPALRRVRQVSPSNRSDGFLGSDLSQDDGPFFDGKPQDFVWKLAGETEMYRLTDPFSLKKDVDFQKGSDGGWRILTKDVPRTGYQVTGWKGLGWAPLSLCLAKRKLWIIEGTPKDRYYLFGKIQLYIEKDSFEGTWNRKFDWKGELVNYFVNGRGMKQSPDGHDYFDAGPAAIIFAENVRMNRATVAQPPPGKNTPFVTYRTRSDPRLFEYQELMRVGK